MPYPAENFTTLSLPLLFGVLMQAKLISGAALDWVHDAASAAVPLNPKTQQNGTDSTRSDVATLSARAKALQLHEEGESVSAIAVILDVSLAQVNEYLRIPGQTQAATAGAYLGPTPLVANHSLTRNGQSTSASRAASNGY
jgi:hypothetical protein